MAEEVINRDPRGERRSLKSLKLRSSEVGALAFATA